MRSRASRWRIALLAGAGFFLLQLGWSLAVAPNFGIDEFDHAYRASSVAQGHWQAGTEAAPDGLGRGDLIPVRIDVARAARNACTLRPYTEKYDCEPASSAGGNEVLISSAAARYNPTYYAVVGTMAKPFHGTANLYAMRIATALIASALFTTILLVGLTGTTTSWPLTVALLGAVPTTVYSTSIASPNGIEMVAGLGVWVALLAVVGRRDRATAYGVLALCAGILVNTHTLGLLWLALTLVTIALIHGPSTTVKALLPRSTRERLVAVLGLGAITFELVWLLTTRVNDPSTVTGNFEASPWGYVASGLVLWPLQAIGAVPMRNDPAPLIVYAAVLALAGGLVAIAVRRRALRSRSGLAVVFVVVVSYLVPAVATVRTFETLGSAWQGRYGMPFTIGALVILGSLLEADGATRWARPFAFAVAITMPVVHLIGELHVRSGLIEWFGTLHGTHWSAPSGLTLVALGVLALACWTGAAREATGSAHDRETEVTADDRRPAAVLR